MLETPHQHSISRPCRQWQVYPSRSFAILNRSDNKGISRKVEMESKQFGMPSFKYTQILDTSKIQRQRGITFDMKTRMIQTQNINIRLIDTPGVGSFKKNLISGLGQATAAILMIACNDPEYDIGLNHGYTLQHVKIAFCMGIKQLIICVNKIDLVEYSEKRYLKVVKQMKEHLLKIGYRENMLVFLPISGFKGDNLIEKSQNLQWYQGDSLIQEIKKLEPEKLTPQKPFRMSIQHAFKIGGVGTIVRGKVESGSIKSGDYVTFMPGNIQTSARSLEMNNQLIHEAKTGENVAFNLANVKPKWFKRGIVCYLTKDKPQEMDSFQAEVQLFSLPNPIKNGFCPILHIHTAHVATEFNKILSVIDKRTGKEIQNEPKKVKGNSRIVVLMKSIKQIAMEKYSDCAKMGKFLLRDQNKVIGCGIVKEINYKGQGTI